MWDIHQHNIHITRVKSALSRTYILQQKIELNDLSVMTDDIIVPFLRLKLWSDPTPLDFVF